MRAEGRAGGVPGIGAEGKPGPVTGGAVLDGRTDGRASERASTRPGCGSGLHKYLYFIHPSIRPSVRPSIFSVAAAFAAGNGGLQTTTMAATTTCVSQRSAPFVKPVIYIPAAAPLWSTRPLARLAFQPVRRCYHFGRPMRRWMRRRGAARRLPVISAQGPRTNERTSGLREASQQVS